MLRICCVVVLILTSLIPARLSMQTGSGPAPVPQPQGGLEQGGEWDPEYRSRLRDAGERFSAKEGESIQLDLPLSGL